MDKDNEITLEDVKNFIDANKADASVVEYITSISIDKPLNPEVVKGYLETIEGKTVIQPILDSFASRSIASHDEKKKKEIEAEIARKVNEKLMEMNKEDTPEQKAYKEQAQRIKDLEEQYENDKKLAKINEIAYKEGIDPAFVEGLTFDSAEHFGLYANRFKEYVKKANEKVVNELMAATPKPKGGKGQEEKVDISKLSDDEILKMEMAGTLDTLLKN